MFSAITRMRDCWAFMAPAATAMAVALIAVFAIAGEPLVGAAFGDRYADEAARLLLILSIGQLGAVWSGSCAIVLLQAGHQRLLFRITAVVVVIELLSIQVALNIGGTGAVAVVAGVCLALQNAAIVVADRVVVGVRTDASLAVTWREVRGWLRRRRNT